MHMSSPIGVKVSKYGLFSSPNTGKCGPGKTPYLDTFDVMDSVCHWYLQQFCEDP